MKPRRVVLLSEHVYESPRRAGFHWLADAYIQSGWSALFATTGVSRLSGMLGDFRMTILPRSSCNRVRRIDEKADGFLWYPPFHPVNLRYGLANRLSRAVFSLYPILPLHGLEKAMTGADTVIVESGMGLALVPRLKKLLPNAHFVYRVSDDVRVIGAHPIVADFEAAALKHFELISVPSDHMVKLFPKEMPVKVHYHGLNKSLFDELRPNPYGGGINIVSVGTTLFDRRAVETFATACPEIQFHIFGRITKAFDQANIVMHGEQRFAETVPYIQHANAGLAPYLYRPDCEYLAHTSNKMIQYTYCRLPVLLPYFVPNDASHIMHYKPHDKTSARAAVDRALALAHESVDRSGVFTWEEVRERIEGARRRGT